MRRLVGGAVAVGCLVGFIGLVVVPAHAQQSLLDSDPDVIRARTALREAQTAAHAAAAEVARVTEQRDAAQAEIDDRVARIAELDAQRAELAAQRDQLKADLRERAVALYRAGGDAYTFESLSAPKAVDAARQKQLGDVAAGMTLRTAQNLADTREELGVVQDGLRREEEALQAQKASLDQHLAQQARLEQVMLEKVAAADRALERARAVGALRLAGDPVMGPSLLTAAQMTAWYRAQGYRPRLEIEVSELARVFVEEGAAENVRGDFAFAQAIIETGGFASAPANNFSGIGWCDSCSTGNKFPTPRDGVRAQIQLLVNYADAGSRASRLRNPVSPYLYGSDPVAAARRFDTFYAKGWAPTWSEMGRGNWATDPNYSQKVIGVYRKMTSFGRGG